MKTYILFALSILLSYSVSAQERGQRHQKIQSAKVAHITERMELTPAQAERFWPVYNEYQNKRRELHRLTNPRRQGITAEISETQAKAWLEKKLDAKERELDLDKKYLPLLIETTSARQVMALENAEREFRGMLLQRLRGRK